MKNRKVILHIIGTLGQGGAENTLYRLLQQMAGAEYQISVLVFSGSGFYSKKIEDLGVKIIYLHMNKRHFFSDLYNMLKIIKEIKPNIVQTWMHQADFLGGICAKIAGVKKIIWGVRNVGDNLDIQAKVFKIACISFSWFIPNVIIANSTRAARRHITAGYCSKKMRIIHNGFDADIYTIKPDKSELKNCLPKKFIQDPIFIGTLARYHFVKGYHKLINIIDRVCEQHSNVYFILCGRNCNDDNHIIATALNKLKYKEQVILIDATDNVPVYLNSLDIFVMPSLSESFPNALAEAMLCGLPCIATEVGDVKNIVGETGIIIAPKNEAQLAEACLKMLEMPKKDREKMGIQARNRIKQHFSQEHMVKQFIEVYQ